MMSKYLRLFGLVLILMMIIPAGSSVFAQTTTLANTFTYQGYLANNGNPVTATCDFKFGLYSVVSGGTPIGGAGNVLTRTAGVSGGVFTVQLDFGAGVFDGTDRYLDIQVACPTGGAFVPLLPRSPVTSAPSAIFAANATN